MFRSSNYAAPPALENCYSGPIRQGVGAHALHSAYGYGAAKGISDQMRKVKAAAAAAKAKPKPRVTKAELDSAVKKNKFLRDEDQKLAVFLTRGDLKSASPILKQLAAMRDRLRKKSIAAAEGKTAAQVAGRAYLGVVTLGASEVGRLLVKKKISNARRKRAQAFLDQSVACDNVMRFYTAAFADAAAKANSLPLKSLNPAQKALLAAAKADGANLQKLQVDGAAADVKVDASLEAAEKSADAAVEAEAPAAAVAAEASKEDLSAVQAPVATEGEAAAISEAAAAGEDPAKAVDSAVAESGRKEMTGKPGLSTKAKVGIGAGVGISLLAAITLLK